MNYMIKHPNGRTEPARLDQIRTAHREHLYPDETQFHRIKWPDELNPFTRREYHSIRHYPELLDPPRKTDYGPSALEPLVSIIGGVVGCGVGLALSYWLQPGALRMLVSLPSYLSELGTFSRYVGDSQATAIVVTAIWSAGICAIIGTLIGLKYAERNLTRSAPRKA